METVIFIGIIINFWKFENQLRNIFYKLKISTQNCNVFAPKFFL